MPDKKSTPKTKKKTPEPVELKEMEKVVYVCRNCHDKKQAMVEMLWCVNTIGIKAQQCPKCKKWGHYVASMKIDDKEIRWAVVDYYFDRESGKEIILDESTNNSNRLKKIIYGDLPKDELAAKKPFKGINHPQNFCISGEKMVDANMKPIKPKWSAKFQKEHRKILDPPK